MARDSATEHIAWPPATPAKLSTLPRDELELLAGLPTDPALRYCRMLSCLESGGVWPLLSCEPQPLPGEGSPVEGRPSSPRLCGLGDSEGVLETRERRSDRLSTERSPTSPLASSARDVGTAGERWGRLEELEGVPGEKWRSMGDDRGSGEGRAGCELGRDKDGGVREGSGLSPPSGPWPGDMAGEGGGLRRWSG